MSTLIGLFVLCVLAKGVQLPAAPLEQTDVQQDIYLRDTEPAASLSASAVDLVTSMIDGVKGYLDTQLTASEMLNLLVEEIQVTELLTNLEAVSSSTADVQGFDTAEENPYWPSEWQVLAMNDTLPSSCLNRYYKGENAAEMNVYGFPPFGNGSSCNPKSFWEASNRSFYIAFNLFRIDIGNPTFGDVSFVWRRLPIVVSPIDTGYFEMYCNESFKKTNLMRFNCSAWKDGQLGSASDFLHLIPVTANFYWHDAWLLELLKRTVTDKAWGDTSFSPRHLVNYWEAMPMKSAYFNESLRFVIAAFPALFGDNEHGHRLRAWCVRQGKLLVWARGLEDYLETRHIFAETRQRQNSPASRLLPGSPQPLNGRWLDPWVLARLPDGHTTLPKPSETDLHLLKATWRDATARRPYSTDAEWIELYSMLADDRLPSYRAQPLRAGDCQQYAPQENVVDVCIGSTLPLKVNTSTAGQPGVCVCYTSL